MTSLSGPFHMKKKNIFWGDRLRYCFLHLSHLVWTKTKHLVPFWGQMPRFWPKYGPKCVLAIFGSQKIFVWFFQPFWWYLTWFFDHMTRKTPYFGFLVFNVPKSGHLTPKRYQMLCFGPYLLGEVQKTIFEMVPPKKLFYTWNDPTMEWIVLITLFTNLKVDTGR